MICQSIVRIIASVAGVISYRGRLLIGILLVNLHVHAGFGATTIHPENAYAYGGNVGWLNLRGDVTQGASLGLFFSTGFIWSPQVGWILLGSGTPSNGWHYTNDSVSDWGVNHDGEGGLTGFAYGSNIGWLNFGHGISGYEPRVDLGTGVLSGYVWGANIGWISLSNSFVSVQTEVLASGADSTVAGVPVAWVAMKQDDIADLSDDQIRQYYAWDENPTSPTTARISHITPVDSDGVDGIAIAWSARSTRLYKVEMSGDIMNRDAWEDAGFGLLGGVNGLLTQPIPIQGVSRTYFRIRPVVPLADFR